MSHRDLPTGALLERWREFARQRSWLRGYHSNYFPNARYALRRRTGMYLLQRGSNDQPQILLAAYHPVESITWIWGLMWWPPTRKTLLSRRWSRVRKNFGSSYIFSLPLLGTFHFSTQRRMPWRKGTFAKQEEQSLH